MRAGDVIAAAAVAVRGRGICSRCRGTLLVGADRWRLVVRETERTRTQIVGRCCLPPAAVRLLAAQQAERRASEALRATIEPDELVRLLRREARARKRRPSRTAATEVRDAQS